MSKSDATRSNSDEIPIADSTAEYPGNREASNEIQHSGETDVDEFEEDDLYYGEYDGESTKGKQRKRRIYRLFCFNCNRQEGHYNAFRGFWYYSYLLGFTFGLVSWVGPFKCQCCGHKRLMIGDILNVRFWTHQKSGKSKRGR